MIQDYFEVLQLTPPVPGAVRSTLRPKFHRRLRVHKPSRNYGRRNDAICDQQQQPLRANIHLFSSSTSMSAVSIPHAQLSLRLPHPIQTTYTSPATPTPFQPHHPSQPNHPNSPHTPQPRLFHPFPTHRPAPPTSRPPDSAPRPCSKTPRPAPRGPGARSRSGPRIRRGGASVIRAGRRWGG